eukprot:CAMPEP_0118837892 /NCGR_PEP_ID=MMETSP1162-20130426/64220_1 /TAXON_ID=33656 /ORGANISM="Phaeocystis Sp, Strain CCMP2710" /LENGTH=96 /DNA_ID=CAMNT_0006769801 /DNA_START=11 /DNA_END=298 /DNA_ORIENTATION=+
MAFVPPVSRRECLHAGEQPGREVIVRQMAIRHALGRGPARPRDSAKAGDAPHRLHEEAALELWLGRAEPGRAPRGVRHEAGSSAASTARAYSPVVP